MEVILYSKECNWYTRCCPLNGGVRYRECPLHVYKLNRRYLPCNLIGQFKLLIFTYMYMYFGVCALCNCQTENK